jgi:hypothetical protein
MDMCQMTVLTNLVSQIKISKSWSCTLLNYPLPIEFAWDDDELVEEDETMCWDNSEG